MEWLVSENSSETQVGKINVPFYVLTFLGNKKPDFIKCGLVRYEVDNYYPSPMRCGKCYRLGHSTRICHSAKLCSRCCGKDHEKKDCNSRDPKCINCKGKHESTYKQCERYLQEKQI